MPLKLGQREATATTIAMAEISGSSLEWKEPLESKCYAEKFDCSNFNLSIALRCFVDRQTMRVYVLMA